MWIVLRPANLPDDIFIFRKRRVFFKKDCVTHKKNKMKEVFNKKKLINRWWCVAEENEWNSVFDSFKLSEI